MKTEMTKSSELTDLVILSIKVMIDKFIEFTKQGLLHVECRIIAGMLPGSACPCLLMHYDCIARCCGTSTTTSVSLHVTVGRICETLNFVGGYI